MPAPGAGMPEQVVGLLKGVPSTQDVLGEVVRVLGLERVPPAELAKDFDVVLEKMMTEGLRCLQKHQAGVTRRLIDLYLQTEPRDPELALTLIGKGFISMGNQRKKRAGVHMEKCVKWILDRCHVPNEEAAAISGQSDLVVPNAKLLKSHPERVLVLEFKRTIRERWKEVRDEIARTGLKVWLLTLDDYISDNLVRLMARGNITLYVPEVVYRKLKKREGQLRSLKSLVRDLKAVVR